MKQKIIINLGRQLGSGGREIGKKLAKKFEISFYDRKLIEIASEESGLCQEFFEKADEKPSKGILSSIFSIRFPFAGEGTIAQNNCLSNDALFKIQSDAIRHLASKESCIFVGRCADYILRDLPNCINIFITAPKEDRIKRLMKQCTITEEEAIELIDTTDRKRAEYYNYYTNKEWGAASTYHVCINSSMVGVDATVDHLYNFIKHICHIE